MGGESGRSQFKQTLVEFSVVQEVQVKHGYQISSLAMRILRSTYDLAVLRTV